MGYTLRANKAARGFPKSLQTNADMPPRISLNRLLLNPLNISHSPGPVKGPAVCSVYTGARDISVILR
jgi:hypothetical protein